MTTLISADAASVIIAALDDALPDATVSDVALHRNRMVVVQPMSGMRRALSVDTWPVAIQVYAGDDIEAERLCAAALCALQDAVGYEHKSGAFIFDVSDPRLPVNFSDPDAREPRYQATADVGITPPDK